MTVEQTQTHASIALHAVEEVHPQALASPAHVTERTVVDVPAWLVIKQMTDATVVAAHAAVANTAGPSHWLLRVAQHADHLLDCIPVQTVITGFIMADPANKDTAYIRV